MKTKNIKQFLNMDLMQLTAYGTGLLQGKAYSVLHNHLTAVLSPYDLSIPEWKLLGQLHESGRMRLVELAGLLHYDPPMITKLAKRLEMKNLSKRVVDQKDERAKLITISEKGSRLVKDLEPIVKKNIRQLIKGATPDDVRAYIKVLTLIVENASL